MTYQDMRPYIETVDGVCALIASVRVYDADFDSEPYTAPVRDLIAGLPDFIRPILLDKLARA